MKVSHLTSAHPRYDTRIFLKMCRSLGAIGYDVTLIVADGKGEEHKEGVHVLDVGKSGGRLDRMTGATRRVLEAALELDADLYHLHDPELLPVGLKLKRRGKRVIFDAHEDLPKQILSKPYLHPVARRPISMAMSVFERFACSRLDHVVAATPVIRDKFAALGIRSTDINNFPMLGELDGAVPWEQKEREVCYVGGITAIRGIREVIAAMGLCRSRARLNLGGGFPESRVKADVEKMPGWAAVNELGFLSREAVRETLGRSVAGIVTFLPMPNHIDAQPNKMFEYMSAGLPLIASDFPLWREIVEGNDCGVCVDPADPAAIAEAIDRLVENPDLARRMGENGQRAVNERYNWAIEEKKLLALYDTVLLPRA
ncbi:glycosyltransferase family 4 protein [Aquamicrobium lusatiense]|uniref:glycosyltransferase family 4 protein n=1 Tax=Aquamicrobium lusatiense TaxID=89772 RepID=UPI0024586F14|nr:glycosyltransferase family 4 protein [Aquamicrobium lusatiense]MDH4992787.1 glycosyltransferase family 4 protein [Aquamicrobium lusatiense]